MSRQDRVKTTTTSVSSSSSGGGGGVVGGRQSKSESSSKSTTTATSSSSSSLGGISMKLSSSTSSQYSQQQQQVTRRTTTCKPPAAVLSTTAAAAPRFQVASIFNVDSDEDDVEEMPAECKMRMKNVGRETPTSAGPNSFGKTKLGFCNVTHITEKELEDKVQANQPPPNKKKK